MSRFHSDFLRLCPANHNSSITPHSPITAPLGSAIALFTQHVITTPVFKPGSFIFSSVLLTCEGCGGQTVQLVYLNFLLHSLHACNVRCLYERHASTRSQEVVRQYVTPLARFSWSVNNHNFKTSVCSLERSLDPILNYIYPQSHNNPFKISFNIILSNISTSPKRGSFRGG